MVKLCVSPTCYSERDEMRAGGMLVAALLLVGGIGKLYSPDQLQRAVAELTTRSSWWSSMVAIRVFAAAEVATGIALLLPESRIAAAAVAGALGFSFSVFGTAGWIRGATLSCGCLAQFGGSPLGPANVVLGLGIVLVAVANLLLSASPSPTDGWVASVTATAIFMVLLVLPVYHKVIAILVGPREKSTR